MAYTRVEKRKNNITETKMEPPRKALKKNEVIAQYKSLQEKFQILQEQNRVLLENEKKNIESISLLEETVNILEEKVNAPKKEKSIVTVSVQTEIIRCEECEYPADDMHDLVDHMHGSHPLESYQDGMTCNHRGEELQTKSDLMMHIQKEHSEKVKVCDYFIEGMCTFGDLCWFSHDESKLLKEFKCIICDCNFGSKSLLMKHRKKNTEGNGFRNKENCPQKILKLIGIFGGGRIILGIFGGAGTFYGWHSQHSRQKLLTFENTKD